MLFDLSTVYHESQIYIQITKGRDCHFFYEIITFSNDWEVKWFVLTLRLYRSHRHTDVPYDHK